MIAIFLIGYALMTILSGALSYDITNFELFGLCLLVYIYYKVFIENKKVLFWSLFTILLASLVGGYYLYRIKMIEDVYHQVVNFLLPFYYSVVVETYFIGRMHQVLMMIVLGLVIFIFFSNLYYIRSLRWITPTFGLIAIISAFLSGTFSGSNDKQAFFFYIISTFVYYYELYYVSIEEHSYRKQRASFYTLACAMSVIVIMLGVVTDAMWHNPFERKVVVVSQDASATQSDTPNLSEQAIKELQFLMPEDYTVQSSFTHEGIELFRVKADTLKYLKVQTFATFDNGTWIDADKKTISQQQWPLEPILYGEIDENAFAKETVEIVYQKITTDSIMTAPFTQNIHFPESNFRLDVERDGAILSDVLLGKGFTYSLDAVIPKYGTKALELLEQSKNNISQTGQSIDSPDSLEGSTWFDEADMAMYTSFPEGYESIEKLSNQITEGIESDSDKAQAIETYLRTQYQYSETPDFKEGKDYIDQFLFDQKVGFCQQFASSMVLLLRAQHIPSRFVIGYVIPTPLDDYESIPEEILYRDQIQRDPYKHVYDSNAHAWVEVFYPGIGWLQFEPTPSQTLVQFYDPIETEVNLTVAEQAAKISYQNRKEITIKVGVILGILLILVMFGFLLKRFMQNYKNSYYRFIRTYRSILRYLEAAKLGKEDSWTLREYSEFLERKHINSQLRFSNFLAILEKAFYNQEEPKEDDILVFEEYQKEIRKFAKRNIQSHRYNRLRLYDFLIIFKGK